MFKIKRLFWNIERCWLEFIFFLKYELRAKCNYRINCLIYGKEKYKQMLWAEVDSMFEDEIKEYNDACAMLAEAFKDEV